MLIAAFAAGAAGAVTGSVAVGLLAAVGASLMLAMVHGLASITFRGNQLISGVAINFLAAGLTVLLGQSWFKQGGRTPALPDGARFTPITLPGTETLGAIPVIGPFYAEVVSGHNLLVYVAAALVPATWWLLYRTRFGLRLRAVGDNPASVDTAGVSVPMMRWAAIAICGALCGLAGAYLSTGLSAGFGKDMTAGRGYIALAALIFANWQPWRALGTTFLFGLMEAVANRYPEINLGPVMIPSMFMTALPYILTVIILAGFIGRATPPRAGGEPYVKER